MSEPAGPATRTHEERHASWLELFFDLIAIAGIGMLAHLLEAHDTSAGPVGYVIAFTAFWVLWGCFTAYGNSEGDATRITQMLVGMAALGVMTAAVPEIRGEHATAFAIAYVVGRLSVGQAWRRTTVVVDLPFAQSIVGVLPWIVSFWFDGTAQLVLWGVGLGVDLVILVSQTSEKLLGDAQARLDRVLSRVAEAGRTTSDRRSRRARELPTTIEAASSDPGHLAERLGLFVLIVLGEGLIQTIGSASEAAWDRPLAVTGGGAFALVVGLWFLAVRRGYAGVALLPEEALSPRISWLVHLVATASLAAVAAVTGGLVAEPGELVTGHDRGVLLVAYVVYALLAVVVHVLAGLRAGGGAATGTSDDRRVSFVRAACVAVPFLAAAAAVALTGDRAAEGVVWLLAAGVLGAAFADRRATRPRR